LTSSAALRMRLEGNDPHQLVSSSRQCSSTPVGFRQEFHNKEQCYNPRESLIHSWLGSSWFSPVPSTEMSIKETALL